MICIKSFPCGCVDRRIKQLINGYFAGHSSGVVPTNPFKPLCHPIHNYSVLIEFNLSFKAQLVWHQPNEKMKIREKVRISLLSLLIQY